MSDVLLKDKDGVEQSYTGIETVELKTADGLAEFSKGGGDTPVKWRYYASYAVKKAGKTNENMIISITLFDNINILKVWANYASQIVQFGDYYPTASGLYEVSNNYTIDKNTLTLTIPANLTSAYDTKNYIGVLVLYEFNKSNSFLQEDGTYNIEVETGNELNGWSVSGEQVGGTYYPFFYSPMPVKNCVITNVGEKETVPYYFMNSLDTLESIKLPPSLTVIKDRFAYNCEKLNLIDFSNAESVVKLNSPDYINTNNNLIIKVPKKLEAEWKSATNWTNFADKIVGV